MRGTVIDSVWIEQPGELLAQEAEDSVMDPAGMASESEVAIGSGVRWLRIVISGCLLKSFEDGFLAGQLHATNSTLDFERQEGKDITPRSDKIDSSTSISDR